MKRFTLIFSDPIVVDAKVVANIPAPPTTPPAPPVPVTLRTSAPVDPTTAATTVADYQTQLNAINTGVQNLLKQSEQLPIATRITLLQQIQALVQAALVGR